MYLICESYADFGYVKPKQLNTQGVKKFIDKKIGDVRHINTLETQFKTLADKGINKNKNVQRLMNTKNLKYKLDQQISRARKLEKVNKLNGLLS